MGERQNGPLGLSLHLDDRFAPGFLGSGLPSRMVIPGPLGTASWHKAAAITRSEAQAHHHTGTRSPDLERFKRALIAMQVASRLAKDPGRKPVLELKASDRGPIPGNQTMLKSVAAFFNKMWDEIKRDEKAQRGPTSDGSIGVVSGYRSAEQDARAWERAFHKYYEHTLKDRLATGHEFGKEALKVIFLYMNGKKAPPGFSGHTQGIAADLTTMENGKTWTVNSDFDHQTGWQKTWLYGWLVANAWKHKFYQLRTETWHWEYHETSPPNQCWAGRITHRPVSNPK